MNNALLFFILLYFVPVVFCAVIIISWLLKVISNQKKQIYYLLAHSDRKEDWIRLAKFKNNLSPELVDHLITNLLLWWDYTHNDVLQQTGVDRLIYYIGQQKKLDTEMALRLAKNCPRYYLREICSYIPAAEHSPISDVLSERIRMKN